MRKLNLAIAIMLTLAVGVASATTITFTSKSNWNIAVSVIPGYIATFTEDFEGNDIEAPWLSVETFTGAPNHNQWEDSLISPAPVPPMSGSTTFLWTTGYKIMGVMGSFSLNGPPDSGLSLLANFEDTGWTWVMDIAPGTEGFRGFTSDVPFSGLRMVAANNPPDPGTQTFTFDDLSFGYAVPEPATWLLMGIGLLGVGIARKRIAGKK